MEWLTRYLHFGLSDVYGWPSKNKGVNPPNHPFVHRVFHEINHPFWGTPIFGSTPIYKYIYIYILSYTFPKN